MKPDALDLKIAEIEAEVVTEVRRLVVQEYHDECEVIQPECPYLRSTKLCFNIRRALQEEVSIILREMGEKN